MPFLGIPLRKIWLSSGLPPSMKDVFLHVFCIPTVVQFLKCFNIHFKTGIFAFSVGGPFQFFFYSKGTGTRRMMRYRSKWLPDLCSPLQNMLPPTLTALLCAEMHTYGTVSLSHHSIKQMVFVLLAHVYQILSMTERHMLQGRKRWVCFSSSCWDTGFIYPLPFCLYVLCIIITLRGTEKCWLSWLVGAVATKRK